MSHKHVGYLVNIEQSSCTYVRALWKLKIMLTVDIEVCLYNHADGSCSPIFRKKTS